MSLDIAIWALFLANVTFFFRDLLIVRRNYNGYHEQIDNLKKNNKDYEEIIRDKVHRYRSLEQQYDMIMAEHSLFRKQLAIAKERQLEKEKPIDSP